MSERKEAVRGWDGKMSALLAQAPACVAKLCYEYDNAIWSLSKSKRGIDQTKNFEVRPDDVFVISYPKTGTTWTQHIMLQIKYEADMSFFEGKQINHMVPFLEMVDFKCLVGLVEKIKPATPTVDQVAQLRTNVDNANALESPRMLKTHMDPRWIPEALRDDPKAKVVYVSRNPKDTAVSLYHFMQLIKWHPDYASWDEYIEEFMADRVPVGKFYDNILYWWKLKDHPNVLYLKYEDMKEDPRRAVVQIAEFMGKSLSDDVIERIVEATSFKTMKESKSANPDRIINEHDEAAGKDGKDSNSNSEAPIPATKKTFMRKGIVGDWKNYFSDDQNRRFDEIYRERMAGTGLEFRFE